MRISDLKGKKIAVWGLGTEGVQAVRYLTAKEITDKIVLLTIRKRKSRNAAGRLS